MSRWTSPASICARRRRGLSEAYPHLDILPLCADYTAEFTLPRSRWPVRSRVVYFPGSTIGNFYPDQAEAFLRHIAEVCGPGGGLLIGVDLEKAAADFGTRLQRHAGRDGRSST